MSVQGESPSRVPSDRGLPALGMVMQLGAGIFLGMYGMLLGMALFASRGASDAADKLALIAIVGIVRSVCHWLAGRGLVQPGAQNAALRIRVYAAAAAFETVLMLWVGEKLGLSGLLAGLAVGLMAWPAALLALTYWPGFREILEGEIPIGREKSFEGVGVLMTLLGVAGALYAATLGYVFTNGGLATRPYGSEGEPAGSSDGVWLVLLAVAFLTRSVLHAMAGFRGLGAPRAEDFGPSARRYLGASYGSIGLTLIVVFKLFFSAPVGRASGGDMLMVAMFGVLWMLLVWPLAVHSYMGPRQSEVGYIQFETDPNELNIVRTRAPDAGLTWLGWLLFALGVMGAATAVGAWLSTSRGGLGVLMVNPLQPPGRADATWLGLLVAALQLWAAVELVSMSARFRVAALVCGGVSCVATLYQLWPVLGAFRELRAIGGGLGMGGGAVQVLGTAAASLVIPAGTLYLALRTPPGARA